MNKNLKYTRFYLGLFAIIGLISSVLFFVLGYLLGSGDNTGEYSLMAGGIMLLVSVCLLAGVVLIKKNRAIGCILMQSGSAIFILAATYSIYNFTYLFSGWKAVLIPLTIWLPLCTPFAVVIFYIWRWSRS
jgi:high-affinity Fe2+/Pb2+ permease